jgi:hypothetical protein
MRGQPAKALLDTSQRELCKRPAGPLGSAFFKNLVGYQFRHLAQRHLDAGDLASAGGDA